MAPKQVLLGGNSMEIQVEHLGGVQFEIRARQHTIASDQPAENGGFDEGMTPPELLLASLGSCVGFYAAQYLRKHKLATEGTIVRVAADKATDPARLNNFRIDLEIPRELSQQDLEGVEEAARHCLIHNTLLHPPKISIEVKATELAAR
jgi:putative redox protein